MFLFRHKVSQHSIYLNLPIKLYKLYQDSPMPYSMDLVIRLLYLIAAMNIDSGDRGQAIQNIPLVHYSIVFLLDGYQIILMHQEYLLRNFIEV